MPAPNRTDNSLIITLFGPFDVRVNGRPLPHLRTRKGQWLLALLVLRHGRQVERTWLADTLWPESTDRQSLANLRLSVADLRRALGVEAVRLASPTPHTLCLNLTGAEVDVVAFDAFITSDEIADRQNAVNLYRGLLLEGCQEEWIEPDRMMREQAYLNALETLAQDHLSSADPNTAAHYLRLAVALEPARESAQRALMQAFAGSGDYAAVVQTYRDLCRYLHRELQVEPDRETVTLYQRLRAKESVPTQTKRTAQPFFAAVPPPCRLPAPLTQLIGRKQEKQTVIAHIGRQRLVTLTGTGGIGKTRLALAVARDVSENFADGCWFVDLAALKDAVDIPATLMLTLEVQERPNRTHTEMVLDHLRHRSLLLILDNCEHLAVACAHLTQKLLEGCPGLSILATSRHRLGTRGEVTWTVPSLTLPEARLLPEKADDRVGALLASEAAHLFVERARSAFSDFQVTSDNAQDIAHLCHLLDGMPLAIELAAAWCRILSVAQIAARLQSISELMNGECTEALPRQRTLRATLDWSYQLLAPTERALLCRLSVFSGGWTLEAAETVCAVGPESADSVLRILTGLVDKSLIVYSERKGKSRYRFLETTLAYAREKLNDAEQERLSQRHADYFLTLVEGAETESDGADQAGWPDRFEPEYANLRAALNWSLNGGDQDNGDESRVEMGLRLATALYPVWRLTYYLREGRQFLDRLLAQDAEGTPIVRARALHTAGCLAAYQCDYKAARSNFEASLAIGTDTGARGLEADNCCQLGILAWKEGLLPEARNLLEKSLTIYQQLDYWKGIAVAVGNLGIVARREGDYTNARKWSQASLELCWQHDDQEGIAYNLRSLGVLSCHMGMWDEAQIYHEQSLAVSRKAGHQWGIATALDNLSNIALERRDYARVRSLSTESLLIRLEQKDQRGLLDSCETLVRLLGAEGVPKRAASLLGAAESLSRQLQASLHTVFADYDRTVREARADLSPETFMAAWTAGRAISLVEMVTSLLA